ncbi:MAG: SCO family protein [Cytophagales bacterium]|nr:SCO family protein [Cytophagales bacterium]
MGLMLACFVSCVLNEKKLPIMGWRHTEEKTVNGKAVVDTVYQSIADFSFVNQNGEQVTNKDYAGKIYIADFFFTTCPTICPVMKTQMLRVYERIKDNPNVFILSHSIDPEHDSAEVLHSFAERLGVEAPKWNFVTGDKESIYEIGQTSYIVSVAEDKNAPGGYIHSGAFILIDPNRHIRGIYDGTKADQVDRLMNDLPLLEKEFFENN